MRDSGRLPLCARGDINSYAVFAETMRHVLNESGHAGCVLPTGIATDDTTKHFFQDVMETRSLVTLFDFENRRGLFPDVDSRMKFCLFTCGNGEQPAADRAEFAFFAHAIEDLHDPERRFTLSPDDISLLNPNTRTCPTFRSRRDAELAKAIYRRVPVLVRRTHDGQPEENPWGIRFSTMFHMSNDSHLFRTREQLEADGWALAGNVFRREAEEHLPLYEAKMVHHFDHRWASYQVKGGKEAAIDVSLEDKENPDFTVLPRYWVAAREVHLRTANLPKGLLAALRDRNSDQTVLAVCHLLFITRLREESAGSADTAVHEVFPTWIAFVEQHPVARSLPPTQMGLCGNNSPSIEPPGPSYLPAEPLDKIESGPRASTAWYPVDPHALAQSFASFEPYGELLESVPPLRTEDEALAFADELLSRASPRWLMGWRDITRSTDERTTIADIIPFAAVGDKLLLMSPSTTARRVAALLGSLNSFVSDFVARQKISGVSLKYFTMRQIAVLPPAGFSVAELEFMVPRVLELLYTGEGFREFASDCGWDDPPFRWDEGRRFLLRCELDAAFFHLYLPTEENGDWRPARRSDGSPHDETPEQLAELKHRFPTPPRRRRLHPGHVPHRPPQGRTATRRLPHQAHHPRNLRRNADIHRHRRPLPDPARPTARRPEPPPPTPHNRTRPTAPSRHRAPAMTVTTVTSRDEPYRVSRRLQTLRDWSHETYKQILPGASGTGDVKPGSRRRARCWRWSRRRRRWRRTTRNPRGSCGPCSRRCE